MSKLEKNIIWVMGLVAAFGAPIFMPSMTTQIAFFYG
jgi:type IV secretory pathway VirB2 component (pilin)